MTNKIGWCDMTFNPVWGCLNHCEYCYARKIAKRFANKMAICEIFRPGDGDEASKKINNLSNRLKEFIPTFLYGQYYKKLPEKSQKIFIGSMSEISHWDQKWIVDVIHKIKQYPQHIFQFLTRYPDIYLKYVFPKNCWLGMTITKEEDIDKNWGYFFNENNRCFFSIEPFLDRINPESLEYIDWVIIGFQTNPFKKIKKEAITNVIEWTKKNNIPLFLKDSIYKIYPDLPIIKEFPDEL
jgi:protein gp37